MEGTPPQSDLDTPSSLRSQSAASTTAGQVGRGVASLSRDSRLGQRKHPALCVQLVHCLVDRPIKFVSISEGLMGEVMP